MMDTSCFGNMIEVVSFEDDISLEALRDQPWKVNGRIDADGSKRESMGNSRVELLRRDLLVLHIYFISPARKKKTDE